MMFLVKGAGHIFRFQFAFNVGSCIYAQLQFTVVSLLKTTFNHETMSAYRLKCFGEAYLMKTWTNDCLSGWTWNSTLPSQMRFPTSSWWLLATAVGITRTDLSKVSPGTLKQNDCLRGTMFSFHVEVSEGRMFQKYLMTMRYDTMTG